MSARAGLGAPRIARAEARERREGAPTLELDKPLVRASTALGNDDPEPFVTESGQRQATSVVPYRFGARTYADYDPRTEFGRRRAHHGNPVLIELRRRSRELGHLDPACFDPAWAWHTAALFDSTASDVAHAHRVISRLAAALRARLTDLGHKVARWTPLTAEEAKFVHSYSHFAHPALQVVLERLHDEYRRGVRCGACCRFDGGDDCRHNC